MQLVNPLQEQVRAEAGYSDSDPDDGSRAWLFSLFVHMAILVALAFYGTRRFPEQRYLTLTTTQPAEEMLKPDAFTFSPEPRPTIGAAAANAAGDAFTAAPVVSVESAIPTPELEPVEQVDASPTQSFRPEVLVATGPRFSEQVTVRGNPGVGVSGTEGAIDRLTHEILLSLEQRRTLVVWLFDQSGSLEMQRASILKRFDRIYEELGVIEASGNPAFRQHDNKPLLSAVVAFGQRVSFLTQKPTDELPALKDAVREISTDTSGKENVFSAVYQAVDKFRNYRTQVPRRNIIIVIFSDEIGDDRNGLDPTVAMCRKYEVPVYVVGVPAPFGRENVLVKYVDPDPKFDQSPQWIPVMQGPESLMPEAIRLGMAGSDEYDEPMDSGFGPFHLTRLCAETGGMYFSVHPNRNSKRAVRMSETGVMSAQLTYFFDSQVMRNYRPDYVSANQYKRLLDENAARSALVKAAGLSWLSPMERPQLYFPKISDGDFANRISRAQQAAAILEPKLARLYDVLKHGEKDRPALTGARWQAGYDLAIGRVLAVKVRTESYNAMLAKAKQGLKFKDPKNDTWRLMPADEISVGSVLEKQAAQARTHLTRVVDEHPNTPWALLARQELKEPLGWQWQESYTGVMKPKEGIPEGDAGPPPKDDERRMLKRPPPRRPVPKL